MGLLPNFVLSFSRTKKKKSIPFNLLCIFIQSVILILQFSGGEKTHAVRSKRDSMSPPAPLLLLSQFVFTQHDVQPLLQLSADISHVLGRRITQKSRWENNRQQTFMRTVVMRQCVWLCFLPRVAIFVCKRQRPLHHYLRPQPQLFCYCVTLSFTPIHLYDVWVHLAHTYGHYNYVSHLLH